MGGKSAAVALIKWLRTTTATLGQFQTQSSTLFSFSYAANPCSCKHNNGCFCPLPPPLCLSLSLSLSSTLSYSHTHTHTVSKMWGKVGGKPLWDTVKPWQPFIKQAKLKVCKLVLTSSTPAHPPQPYPTGAVCGSSLHILYLLVVRSIVSLVACEQERVFDLHLHIITGM